jgi:60 kDa SS-A/Ro ribonucleoprotein
MTATLLRHTTPATAVITNNAGGESFTVDKWSRLHRFLILGIEGGTYYVDEKTHTLDNIKVVDMCLNEDPERTINLIETISQAGRAPKNDYAIFALAKAASHPDSYVSRGALMRLNSVCRTGTHLLQFVAFVDTMRGWGPSLRKAVSSWYLSKDADALAYQLLKYQSRSGWTQRDVLRKAHPKASTPAQNAVLRYITNKNMAEFRDTSPKLLLAHDYIHSDMTVEAEEVADVIRLFDASREMLPSYWLTHPVVLEALAEKMPYTALMRNLGNLTRHGVLQNKVDEVTHKLTDSNYIAKSRVHPISILTALRTYTQGAGFRGSNTWTPIGAISDSLETAFYEAFKHVEPTNQRFLVGMDVSGSMSAQIDNGVLTSAEAAAAILMLLFRTENWVKPMAFCNQFIDLPVHPMDRLEDVLRTTRRMNFGSTDCAQPMLYALQQKLMVDVFVVITDNETWAGRVNPHVALQEYRRSLNPKAKLLVLATAATPFSIANPKDPGMLDIAGFDSAVPEILSLFARGEV